MNVSVVVPVLEEERVIARRLESLAATPEIAEVVVVDVSVQVTPSFILVRRF